MRPCELCGTAIESNARICGRCADLPNPLHEAAANRREANALKAREAEKRERQQEGREVAFVQIASLIGCVILVALPALLYPYFGGAGAIVGMVLALVFIAVFPFAAGG